MPKITDEELTRTSFMIPKRDIERLQRLAIKGKSMGRIMRAMIRTSLNQIEAMQNAEIDANEGKEHERSEVGEHLLHSPTDG